MMTPAERNLLKQIARLLIVALSTKVDPMIHDQRRRLAEAIDQLQGEESGGYEAGGGQ